MAGTELSNLHDALMSAFPSRGSLARLIRYGLNESLDAIAHGNQSDLVFDTITWAHSSGRLDELIDAALAACPASSSLQKFVSDRAIQGSIQGSKSQTGVTIEQPRTNYKPVKVLYLCANAKGDQPLELDEEVREIAMKIRTSRHRDAIEFISQWAIRSNDLLVALTEFQPQIVHFGGHGTSHGDLVLLDNNRRPKVVSAVAIQELFRSFKTTVRLVLLNACFSLDLAEAIKKHIDCAVGMEGSISDSGAIVFAASFYYSIGSGSSVARAYEDARLALMLEGISEADSPRLMVREGVDPAQVVPVSF